MKIISVPSHSKYCSASNEAVARYVFKIAVQKELFLFFKNVFESDQFSPN